MSPEGMIGPGQGEIREEDGEVDVSRVLYS